MQNSKLFRNDDDDNYERSMLYIRVVLEFRVLMLVFSGGRIENISLQNLIEMRCSEGFRAVELVVKQPQLSSSSSAGAGGGGGGTPGFAIGSVAGGVMGEGDSKRVKRGSPAVAVASAGRRVRKPSISYGNVE